MLKSKELRAKAWESLKGKYWMAFVVMLVAIIVESFGNSFISFAQDLLEALKLVDPAEMDAEMKAGALLLNGVAGGSTLIGALVSIFVSSAVTVGVCNYFIKNTDSKPAFAEIFSGFKVKYGRNIGTLLLVAVRVVLWTLLFIVPGIIKMFEYSMIPFILADNPEITCKEAFKLSKQMMTGNKWRFFKLDISFIGWMLLCIPTLGIGIFFLAPYMEAAYAEFYNEIKNK